jgi:5-methylcytosine-specific restriction endonuclease McrA
LGKQALLDIINLPLCFALARETKGYFVGPITMLTNQDAAEWLISNTKPCPECENETLPENFVGYICKSCFGKQKRAFWEKKRATKPTTYKDLEFKLNHIRRARIAQNGGTITGREWSDLKKKYNFTCLCCKRREPEIKLCLDHVIPIARGGPNTIENAQPLCVSCNTKKQTKTIDYRP